MKRWILALVIGLLPSVGNAALIQHWPLNDNAASTTLIASVGTNGALGGGDNTSALTTAGPGGSITAGLQLDGSADYLDFSAAAVSFANSTNWTVSFWFKTSTTPNFVNIGVQNISGSIPSLTLSNATTVTFTNAGGTSRAFTFPNFADGNWHHLVVVGEWTGSARNCRMFLDGTESSSGSQSLGGNSSFTFTYMSYGNTSARFLNGALAQVKLFDSDESANVASLYAEGTGGPPSTGNFLLLFGMLAPLGFPAAIVLPVAYRRRQTKP